MSTGHCPVRNKLSVDFPFQLTLSSGQPIDISAQIQEFNGLLAELTAFGRKKILKGLKFAFGWSFCHKFVVFAFESSASGSGRSFDMKGKSKGNQAGMTAKLSKF